MNPLLQIVPYDQSLTTQCLGRAFRDTVASYKFYWFVSILKLFTQKSSQVLLSVHEKVSIPVDEIVQEMIASAWYPVAFCRLSFGKSDSMTTAIQALQCLSGLDIQAKEEEVRQALQAFSTEKEVKKMKHILLQNVPYRFLYPWIPTSDDALMVQRSLRFENNCLYALVKDEKNHLVSIEINPLWNLYLLNNAAILTDFAYRNLINFLQIRNPSVPNISNKLVRPDSRNSLNQQHRFWDSVLDYAQTQSEYFYCIYTHQVLQAKDYDLDHFIPWSFVTHDLAWNLVPSNSSINSSKSNKIPDIDYYLPKMAKMHHQALLDYQAMGKSVDKLEDYFTLGCKTSDLVQMSDEKFYEVFFNTFSPMSQIALNMGFEKWSYHE